jgi:hypothetical protein
VEFCSVSSRVGVLCQGGDAVEVGNLKMWEGVEVGGVSSRVGVRCEGCADVEIGNGNFGKVGDAL